jgi:hypothetical protein
MSKKFSDWFEKTAERVPNWVWVVFIATIIIASLAYGLVRELRIWGVI